MVVRVRRRHSGWTVMGRDDKGETESDEMRGCKVLQELTGSTGKATLETTLDVCGGKGRTFWKPMAAAFSRKH